MIVQYETIDLLAMSPETLVRIQTDLQTVLSSKDTREFQRVYARDVAAAIIKILIEA